MIDTKRIYLKFERLSEEIKLEQSFQKDEEKNIYIMGIASTEDENCNGFVVENQSLLECWKSLKQEGKNVAVYEKHSYPVGKVVNCEEYNDKVIVTLEIPKQGNDRVLAVYEQGIYVGLSIGGWSLDGEWIKNENEEDVYHVTKFDWYEVSLTDVPANENALLLEAALATKPKEAEEPKDEEPVEEPKEEKEEPKNIEQEITEEDIKITLEKITETIRGNF